MYRYIKVVLFSLICLVGTFFVLTICVHAQIQTIPAPTMIEPGESAITDKVKPLIKGLTVNGTFVRVYIDGIYNGKTEILTDNSGVANFAFRPFLNLKVGQHTVWAIAEDEYGSKSSPSNVLKFSIEQPAIIQAIQEEYKETPVEVKGIEGILEESEAVILPIKNIAEKADKEEGEIIDKEIKHLIEQGIEETTNIGLINEDKEKQGKLNFNLIIFIVFLLGIIAWIFWINRELIKERRVQAKKTQDAIEDKTNKIKPSTIQDIEKSNKDDLPSPPQEQPPLV